MTRLTSRTTLGLAIVLAGFAGQAMAQDADQKPVESECPAPATQAEPATSPDPSEDATAAENSGTTGWSGGTGGSQLGTNGQGAVEQSLTWQPPTARGLDLKAAASDTAEC
ncbi:hypothetical protein [Paracoccus sp. JM45]|uniref:hypothetical protein n=1 Tax=Paracoccus sp. JM45 TaxID=2283626 RepID=UPI000E6C835A|nr:hypothetical protein [Paracoccus sp. JM45]RJE78821.1 hypothetical protein DWB67_15610 [Paracoccus sp. JM45]